MSLRIFLFQTVFLTFFSSSCSNLKLSNREKIYGMTALGIAGRVGYGLNQS